jgi:hypothetical protein
MRWDIVNTDVHIPKCIICHTPGGQMARFDNANNGYTYICSNCGRFVKAAMNKWKELKDPNYIQNTGSIFDSDYIDDMIIKDKHKRKHK